VLEADLAHCRAEIARLGESEDSTAPKSTQEKTLGEQRRALEEIDAQIASSRSELQRLESEINAIETESNSIGSGPRN
jgi:septal ring factor EnvC (AmiA/AmiB activator)